VTTGSDFVPSSGEGAAFPGSPEAAELIAIAHYRGPLMRRPDALNRETLGSLAGTIRLVQAYPMTRRLKPRTPRSVSNTR
jgi:hypothetical protein